MDITILTWSLLSQFSSLILKCSGFRKQIPQAPVLKAAMVQWLLSNSWTFYKKQYWNNNQSSDAYWSRKQKICRGLFFLTVFHGTRFLTVVIQMGGGGGSRQEKDDTFPNGKAPFNTNTQANHWCSVCFSKFSILYFFRLCIYKIFVPR